MSQTQHAKPPACSSYLPRNPNVPYVEREPCANPHPHQDWEHRTAREQQLWEERQMRQQEEARPDTERGLYGKFEVHRRRDPDGKHEDCRYFVLDPQHDPIARVALKVYAWVARCRGFKPLAADLTAWLEPIRPSERNEL